MQVPTPFTAVDATNNFFFKVWVRDVLDAEAQGLSPTITITKPTIPQTRARLDQLYNGILGEQHLGDVNEATQIIALLGKEDIASQTPGQQELFRKQIDHFADILVNMTTSSKGVPEQQQIILSTRDLSENPQYVSTTTAKKLTDTINRILDTILQGRRGADRTVILGSLATFQNLAASPAHNIPAVSIETRAQFERDMRDSVWKARMALAYKLVDNEELTIPGPDDTNWYQKPKAAPPNTISMTAEPASRVDSRVFGIGHSTARTGQMSFQRSGMATAVETTVQNAFVGAAAKSGQRALLELQSGAYPGCIVGTVRYLKTLAPFGVGTVGKEVVLSDVFANTFDCRANERLNYQSIPMAGLDGRLEFYGGQFDENTACADYLEAPEKWTQTGLPTYKTNGNVRTSICRYAVLANNMALLYKKAVPKPTPNPPAFIADDKLSWWAILLIILACFAFIYIVVFAYIKFLYTKRVDPEADATPMVRDENSGASADSAGGARGEEESQQMLV